MSKFIENVPTEVFTAKVDRPTVLNKKDNYKQVTIRDWVDLDSTPDSGFRKASLTADGDDITRFMHWGSAKDLVKESGNYTEVEATEDTPASINLNWEDTPFKITKGELLLQ